MIGALHGILAMLTGKGEKKNRQMRRKFHDAIPAEPGFDEHNHPAVTGPLANSVEGFGYRRANANHGPLSKRQHTRREQYAEYQRQVQEAQAEGLTALGFEDWLRQG